MFKPSSPGRLPALVQTLALLVLASRTSVPLAHEACGCGSENFADTIVASAVPTGHEHDLITCPLCSAAGGSSTAEITASASFACTAVAGGPRSCDTSFRRVLRLDLNAGTPRGPPVR